MKLSNQQREAMQHYLGPGLTLAVPGAGKTTVLIYRILHLIEKYNIPPEKILSITFSKNQTVDMKERFEKITEERGNKVSGNFYTIHAFSYKILREYLKRHHLNLTLIEGNSFNKNKLIRRIHFEKFREYISPEEIEKFNAHYSLMKNKMIPLEEYMKNTSVPHKFKDLYREYEKAKKGNYLIDFEDMLYKTYEILEEDKTILGRIKRQYPFIQVDEAQDTSPLQIQIIRKIAEPENNFFIVADDDQSIYGFRGAEPSFLLNFKNNYPEGKIYYIEENFRSTPTIIETAHTIIDKNKNRYRKNIYTQKKETFPIRLIKTKTTYGQYKFLAEELKENEGKTAVLFRNNLSSLALLNYLDRENISFSIRSSPYQYLNHFLLEDIVNIIAFAEKPEDQQIFEKIYYKLGAYISRKQLSYLPTFDENTSILQQILDDPSLKDYQIGKIEKIIKVLKKIKKSKIEDAIDLIFYDLDYENYLDKKLSLEDRTESIQFLLESYKEIFKDCENSEELLFKRKEIIGKIKYYEKINSDITLSTIHRSKGLEYDKVYIIDLIGGEFPSRSQDPLLSERIKHSEEERRLFYVAMTRAKKELILITSKERNGNKVGSSKFYEEVKNTKRKVERKERK